MSEELPKSGKGGNVRFKTGAGGAGSEPFVLPGDCGDFHFYLGGGAHGEEREVLRITPEGFFVEGRKVSDDVEVYHTFKAWLDVATIRRLQGAAVAEGRGLHDEQ